METQKCDANTPSKKASDIFPKWTEKALDILTLKYPLKKYSLDDLTGGFNVEISQGKINWET